MVTKQQLQPLLKTILMANNKVLQTFNYFLLSIILIKITSCSSCRNNNEEKIVKEIQHIVDTTSLTDYTIKTYLLKPSENTLIKCEGGTQIYYFANTLVDNDNKVVKDSVTLQIAECYNASDFIKCNITTQYGDSLLQTGGCVNISFKQKGKELKIKEGNNYQIAFPKRGNKKNMKLYEGDRSNGKVVWKRELEKVNIDYSKFIGEDGEPFILLDTLNYYVFASKIANWTNWINCDQLLLKDKDNLDFVVDLDTLISANINLIFPSIKSASMPFLQGNKLKFHQVPTEYKSILFGYTQINGVYYYCKQNLVLKEMNQVIKPKFIKSTKEEIMKIADEIKWEDNV